MRRSWALFSPKQKLGGHPQSTSVGKNFWKPKYGASKMKWNFTIPYFREVESLLHYPAISHVTGKPVDWYNGEPTDGYEGSRLFGEHTLKLSGMPLGHTPEYMQERLRRFFAKFGPVRHCRAEPHPLDPYQCEGTAFVTFQDKKTALQAMRAPLKFPASLHDKVVSMMHLDSDKRNDPNYFEKSKLWNRQLISIARQLHAQLSADPSLRVSGKPLTCVGRGLTERELLPIPDAIVGEPAPRGRGGVPVSQGLFGAPSRDVPAGPAVHLRFGSWDAFLATPPLDELFRIDRIPTIGNTDEEARDVSWQDVEIFPRLVGTTQRSRILTRARKEFAKLLHAEFSIWWREGKVRLPEYTQQRVDWWDHKPKLPTDLQMMSRPKAQMRVFDEKVLYKLQLVKSRNEQRKERRQEWQVERKKMLAEKQSKFEDRKKKALGAIEGAKCRGLLGVSPGLVSSHAEGRNTRRVGGRADR